jgi:hypothetical protein
MDIVRFGIFDGGAVTITRQRIFYVLTLIQFQMLNPLLASGKGLDHLPSSRSDRGLRGAVLKFDNHFPWYVLRRLHRATGHSIEPSIPLYSIGGASVIPHQ